MLLPSVLVFQENALYISSGGWIIQDLLYLYREETLYLKLRSTFSTAQHCKLEKVGETYVEKEAIRVSPFI